MIFNKTKGKTQICTKCKHYRLSLDDNFNVKESYCSKKAGRFMNERPSAYKSNAENGRFPVKFIGSSPIEFDKEMTIEESDEASKLLHQAVKDKTLESVIRLIYYKGFDSNFGYDYFNGIESCRFFKEKE